MPTAFKTRLAAVELSPQINVPLVQLALSLMLSGSQTVSKDNKLIMGGSGLGFISNPVIMSEVSEIQPSSVQMAEITYVLTVSSTSGFAVVATMVELFSQLTVPLQFVTRSDNVL